MRSPQYLAGHVPEGKLRSAMNFMSGIALLAHALAGGAVQAAPDLVHRLEKIALPPGAIDVGPVEHMRWNGLAFATRTFASKMALPQLLDFLAQAMPIRDEFHAPPAELRLTGVADHLNWMAQLNPVPEGSTEVRLSLLQLPYLASEGQLSPPPRWLPGPGYRLLDVELGFGSARHEVWMQSHTPAMLWPAMHARLKEQGWRKTEEGEAGLEHWRVANRTMDIAVVPCGTGSAVSIQWDGHP